MAFTVLIAYTPSVTPDGVTAPPTQGSHSLRNRVRTSEERLPLEGKLAARKG